MNALTQLAPHIVILSLCSALGGSRVVPVVALFGWFCTCVRALRARSSEVPAVEWTQ